MATKSDVNLHRSRFQAYLHVDFVDPKYNSVNTPFHGERVSSRDLNDRAVPDVLIFPDGDVAICSRVLSFLGDTLYMVPKYKIGRTNFFSINDESVRNSIEHHLNYTNGQFHPDTLKWSGRRSKREEDVHERNKNIWDWLRSLVWNREEQEEGPVKGGWATIQIKGQQFSGQIISAENVGTRGNPVWYMELRNLNTSWRYLYWKQSMDGGHLIKVARTEEGLKD